MLTIAVIGAGAAGREFAAACAAAGLRVILEDVMPAKLRRAQEELSRLGHSIELVSTVEDAVRPADIAVDFVPDELESKLEIWSLIDRMAPPRTILCTPSEALSITDLASCTYRDDRCVMVRGALLCGELSGTREVRVLSARPTSQPTVDRVQALFVTLGYAVSVEQDPDLPMLLKNMRAAAIS